jgi:hypothetical protein
MGLGTFMPKLAPAKNNNEATTADGNAIDLFISAPLDRLKHFKSSQIQIFLPA